MESRYDLDRFLAAQNNVYEQVINEIRNGKKETHWMWFIFPQIRGLGRSEAASFYAIENKEEAREYLKHPVLGARLRESTEVVLAIRGKRISEIFPYPDDMKLNSCMTLFACISDIDNIFDDVIKQYFDENHDIKTLELLD